MNSKHFLVFFESIILILLISLSSCKDNSVNSNQGVITASDDIIITKSSVNDSANKIYGLNLSSMKLRYLTNIGLNLTKCYSGKILLGKIGGAFYYSSAYVFDILSGAYTTIPRGNYYPCYFSLSPDAKKILFTCDVENLLVIANADGTGIRELSKDIRGTEYLAEFSRDGRQIAFVEKNQSYQSAIYVIDTSGNNKTFVINIESPSSGDTFDWSPDNKTIVFSNKNSSAKENICKVNTDGTGYINLTNSNFNQVRPEFSPDGQYIAFEELGSSGITDIMYMKADGSGIVNISNTASEHESQPSWSPDGKKILYCKPLLYGGINNYYVYDINTQSSVKIDSVFNANWNYTR